MAAKEETPKEASTENEHQCVINKVAALPMVSAACEMVSATYSSAKESHPAIQAVCDMAETGVKTVATSAVSSAQPLLDKFEPQISAANSYACKGLNKLQETLPALQQSVEKVVLDTKDLVADAKDSICSKVTEVKDVVSSMVDVAKETAQESMEMAKSAVTSGVNTVMETSLAMVAGGIGKVIEKSEELVDHYLPITDEELASLAASLQVESSGIAPMEKQKQQQSYYIQLGTLSTKLRYRAYQHSLGKLQQAKQSSQETLAQLQQAIDLIKYAKQAVDQKIHDGQEKLQEMWRVWKKSQPVEQQEADGESQMEIESKALGLSHALARKLQVICKNLLVNIQGLPVVLQEKMKHTYSNMEDLQTAFSNVRSFQDISGNLLAQSEEKMAKAWETIDELLEYVAEHAPLTWIVGPFSPAETSMAKSADPKVEV
ncbi:perilipin-3-like [Paroedura picta]|uniref:perilipin-3-like n=1 Tax=Paroedura picta TaxID=143630 RepID=UPI004057A20E